MSSATIVGDRLLTPGEVSQFLNVPIERLYRWKREETGPRPIRVGYTLRYRYEEVESWLRSREGYSLPETAA